MACWLWTILPVLGFADPQVVHLKGTVLLPDGKPAAGATVLGVCSHSPTARATTDRDGRFTLTSEFAGFATISALSADGQFVATQRIPAQSIRRRVSEPLLLKMTPANRVEVLVRYQGKPAANVQVGYSKDVAPQRTDQNGRVTIYAPVGESTRISAWDPARGVGAGETQSKNDTSRSATVEIDLQPTAPMKFSVVDEFDRPVAGLKVHAQCALDKRFWFIGSYFPDGYGTTDAKGEWSVSWMPAKCRYPQIELDDPTWQSDGVDDWKQESIPGKLHVRRSHRMKGRVVMPEGVSAENLLIEASSFGPRSRGTSSAARVRADGSFEIPVVSEYFFKMGIVDEEWTSPRHYGVLFEKNETPKELVLKAENATTLEIRVVAGKDRKPVANAWVQGGEDVTKSWRYPDGEKHNYSGALRQYGYTDEQGVVRFGLGREPVSFRASHGTWHEEIAAKPPNSGPFEITFKKPFVDKMRIAGTIVPPPEKSGRVELKAVVGEWDEAKSLIIPVAADGRFTLETEHPKVKFLATDQTAKTHAVLDVSQESDSVVLNMIADGAYGGTAKNPDGDPIPNCSVTLFLDREKKLFAKTVKADAKGKFVFEDIPSETKLSVKIAPIGVETRFLEDGHAYVDRGERRLDAYDVCSELPSTKPAKVRSFAERLAIDIVDARIWHAPALIVAVGPGNEAGMFVKKLSQDEAYTEAEWHYCFPLSVTAEQLASAPSGEAEFTKRGWRIPGAGEVVLAAVTGEGKSLGQIELKVSDAESVKKATAFLAKFAPAKTPAIAAVEAALAEAKKTNRNVFFQLGGLRCGPCYRFARWIDQHHEVLDRDFVFVKLSNLHSDWEKVIDRLQLKPAPGIPWSVILNTEGKTIITGDGPPGNIGFPSGSGVGKKHFRKMLEAGAKKLTDAEREALLASLPRE